MKSIKLWGKVSGIAVAIVATLWWVQCERERTEMQGRAVVFGKLSNGTVIEKYILSNRRGMTAEIINYGAIIVALKTSDREGKIADVILGFDSLEAYERDNSFQGAIVGRYGNRIDKGRFSLDGQTYQLSINNGANHLHGGLKGFYKQVWTREGLNRRSVTLSYCSPDGEEGYPGEVRLTVIYTVTERNELKIEYRGTTDKPTILNPTSHCYFNLSGAPERSILEHELMIDADCFTPVDSGLIPTGEIRAVAGTPFDFRTARAIGQDISANDEQVLLGKGYDHNWVLNGYRRQVRTVATLYEPVSGRLMEVLTDQPGLQFYSGNFLDGSLIGKGGVRYNYRTALCLEAQAFPDSPNKSNFPFVVLRPGMRYRQTTIYRFSTK